MPIQTKLVAVTSVQEQATAASCDRCGSEIPDLAMGPFQRFDLSGGFGNRMPPDMATWEIIVCDDCLKQWFQQFKTPPWTKQDRLALHTEKYELLQVLDDVAFPVGEEYPGYPPDFATWAEDQQYTGLFKHAKGGLYKAHGLVWCQRDEEVLVLYRSVDSEDNWFLRPKSMWLEEVEVSVDVGVGKICKRGPRFTRVLTGEENMWQTVEVVRRSQEGTD